MINTNNPVCTVIIPAYNSEHYIEKSIRSALQQTYTSLQIIVLDDASTDSTYERTSDLAMQDTRIVVIQNPKNLGVASTRNKGFSLAAGEYIALLDADDIWHPQKLEHQIKLLNKTKSDICYSSYSFIDESGRNIRKPYRVTSELAYKQLLKENIIGCSTAVFKTSIAKLYQMRPDFAHEDYVFWLELLRNGYTAIGIDVPLVQYRVLEGSRSNDKKNAAKNRWRIYRDFLHLSYPAAAKAFLWYTLNGIKKHCYPKGR